MPWNETSAMDQRMHFIADYLEDFFPFSELCRRYGISRPTGYKWVQRYVDTGAAGLMAQSRRPVRCPHATSSDLVEAILGRAAHTRRGGPRSCWRSSGDRSRIAPGRHAHRLRHPQTPWPGADAADAAPTGLCGATPDPPERAQSRLDRRLQGAVQDPGWPLLLPADRRRRLQPLPAGVPSPRRAPGATEPAGLPPALPHLWPAPHPPHRQRRPLRLLPGAGTALPTVGLVDPARHLARAHPARLPAAEWAPRTHAWHAQAGGDDSPRRVPLRTAIPLYPLPSRIQPGTTPRGLGTKTSGRVLPAFATSFSQKAAAPTLPCALGSSPGQY